MMPTCQAISECDSRVSRQAIFCLSRWFTTPQSVVLVPQAAVSEEVESAEDM
jgi:hypothetical protein